MATQLVKGNTAVIIGAMYAGCDCYFGYPITPASEVLHEASKYFPMVGRKFVQAESEEAAINMVYGAASTGKRVLCATSGPGMSLKQEGISFLAGSELPCVLVNVQRAGPGLGNIGPMIPAAICKIVVLPLPEGPSSATVSPGAMLRSKFSNRLRPRKAWPTCSKLRAKWSLIV